MLGKRRNRDIPVHWLSVDQTDKVQGLTVPIASIAQAPATLLMRGESH